MKAVAASILISAIAACAPQTVASTTSSSVTVTTTASGPTSTLPPLVQCPGAGEFGEGGAIATVEGEGSDGSALGSISWEVSDQCETFEFEFVTAEGAPATSVPRVEVGHLETFQVLRIRLGASSSVITDQLVESPFVDRLYVVKALDGGIFVDLHLITPVSARARVEASPARLFIDLRPGFAALSGEPAVGDNVVVVSPGADTSVDRQVPVIGYARTFEANVLLIVTQDGTIVRQQDATAADTAELWGEFRTDIVLPEGVSSLFVGEATPGDGSLEGVTLDLTTP